VLELSKPIKNIYTSIFQPGIATDIWNQYQSQSPVQHTSGLRLRLGLIFLFTLVQLCT